MKPLTHPGCAVMHTAGQRSKIPCEVKHQGPRAKVKAGMCNYSPAALSSEMEREAGRMEMSLEGANNGLEAV